MEENDKLVRISDLNIFFFCRFIVFFHLLLIYLFIYVKYKWSEMINQFLLVVLMFCFSIRFIVFFQLLFYLFIYVKYKWRKMMNQFLHVLVVLFFL